MLEDISVQNAVQTIRTNENFLAQFVATTDFNKLIAIACQPPYYQQQEQQAALAQIQQNQMAQHQMFVNPNAPNPMMIPQQQTSQMPPIPYGLANPTQPQQTSQMPPIPLPIALQANLLAANPQIPNPQQQPNPLAALGSVDLSKLLSGVIPVPQQTAQQPQPPNPQQTGMLAADFLAQFGPPPPIPTQAIPTQAIPQIPQIPQQVTGTATNPIVPLDTNALSKLLSNITNPISNLVLPTQQPQIPTPTIPTPIPNAAYDPSSLSNLLQSINPQIPTQQPQRPSPTQQQTQQTTPPPPPQSTDLNAILNPKGAEALSQLLSKLTPAIPTQQQPPIPIQGNFAIPTPQQLPPHLQTIPNPYTAQQQQQTQRNPNFDPRSGSNPVVSISQQQAMANFANDPRRIQHRK